MRDAILYAVGDNAYHGLQRTDADKRRAVETLLNDPEWAAWGDSEIARRCRVHRTTVAKHRAHLSVPTGENRTYVTKHGTVATMATGNIGRQAEVEEPQASPALDAEPAAAAPAPAASPAPAPAPEPEDDGPSADELADA